jgi:hypothetical protein
VKFLSSASFRLRLESSRGDRRCNRLFLGGSSIGSILLQWTGNLQIKEFVALIGFVAFFAFLEFVALIVFVGFVEFIEFIVLIAFVGFVEFVEFR